jgi:hypothetical protein
VKILLDTKLTTPDKVKEVWPGFFGARVPPAVWSTADPILSKIKTYGSEEEARHGDARMTEEQILDVAETVNKNNTEWQKLERDKAKFALDKATGKNKTFI